MKLGCKENVSQFHIYLNVAAKEMALGAFSVIVKLCLWIVCSSKNVTQLAAVSQGQPSPDARN